MKKRIKILTTTLLGIAGVALLAFIRNTTRNKKSLLWRVSVPGGQGHSYIFGTMHLLCADDAKLSPELRKVIRNVNRVYLEADLNGAENAWQELLERGQKKEMSLSEVLTLEEYSVVKDFFESKPIPVPFHVLEKYPPMLLTSWVYESMLPCDEKAGMDQIIMQHALSCGKEVMGIETLQYQTDICYAIPFTEQAKDLYNLISDFKNHSSQFLKMMQLYKLQDIEKLYGLAMNEEGIVYKNTDLLLHNRNKQWAQDLIAAAKISPVLFAVGAGHLSGDLGLLNLLVRIGCSIKPVTKRL